MIIRKIHDYFVIEYYKMKTFFVIIFLTTFSIHAIANDSLLTVIHFPFDVHELSSSSKNFINKLQYKINPQVIKAIVVVGHTDQLGTDEYNFQLSIRRAKAVYQFLKTHWSTLSERIEIDINGMGKSQLLYIDSSEDSRQQNRRVEIYIHFDDYYVQPRKQRPPSVLEQQMTNPRLSINDRILLSNVNFDRGKHTLLPEAKIILDNLSDILITHPNIKIRIEGHVCCTMNDDDDMDVETNQKNLSVMRSYIVYNYLINKGIDFNRLSYVGFAHKFPMADESKLEGQDANRRVEIRIIEK